MPLGVGKEIVRRKVVGKGARSDSADEVTTVTSIDLSMISHRKITDRSLVKIRILSKRLRNLPDGQLLSSIRFS